LVLFVGKFRILIQNLVLIIAYEYVHVNFKVKVKSVPLYAMKAYGGGGG
jgi:hypothetical protein